MLLPQENYSRFLVKNPILIIMTLMDSKKIRSSLFEPVSIHSLATNELIEISTEELLYQLENRIDFFSKFTIPCRSVCLPYIDMSRAQVVGKFKRNPRVVK